MSLLKVVGGGGFTAACGYPCTWAGEVPPSYRRGCRAQGWGVGKARAAVQLLAPAQAGARVVGDGCGLLALAALGNPG